MHSFVRQRLAVDLRQAARVLAEMEEFETGRAIMRDAADEIERLQEVNSALRAALWAHENWTRKNLDLEQIENLDRYVGEVVALEPAQIKGE
jgi:erythromycin esterase-like protein